MKNMKNILLALLAAMGMLATSCSKDEPTEPTDPEPTPVEYQQVVRAVVFGIFEADEEFPEAISISLYTDPYSPNGSSLKSYNALVTADPGNQFQFIHSTYNFATQKYEHEFVGTTPLDSNDCKTGDGKNVVPANCDYQVIVIKPVAGEFTISFKMDFLDSGNKPFRYFKTPAYVLKMWQENGEWKATLTQK